MVEPDSPGPRTSPTEHDIAVRSRLIALLNSPSPRPVSKLADAALRSSADLIAGIDSLPTKLEATIAGALVDIRSALASEAPILEQLITGDKPARDAREVAARVLSDGRATLRRLRSLAPRLLAGGLTIRVLGRGEISETLALEPASGTALLPGRPASVFKRMPRFPDEESAARYAQLYREYNGLLSGAGVTVPGGRAIALPSEDGWRVYATQRRLNVTNVADAVLRRVDAAGAARLITLVLDNLHGVFDFNRGEGAERGVTVGIDGQIPNWIVSGDEDGVSEVSGDEQLAYIDTNSPMIRKNGEEQLDTEIFVGTVPGFLRPIVRRFFLQDILDRYYTPRIVLLDLLANTIVHGRPDLLESLTALVNELTGGWDGYKIAPFTVKEVRKYWREDVLTWKFVRIAKQLETIKDDLWREQHPRALLGLREVWKIANNDLFEHD